MFGIDVSHCNAAICAVLSGYNALLRATTEEALRPTRFYGKNDTLGMDALPEIRIIEQLKKYDNHCLVITEESGPREKDLLTQDFGRTIFISDPMDRSAQVKILLEAIPNKSMSIGDVFRDKKLISAWENNNGSPICATGASSAITCIRNNVPVCTVIINFITHELIVACSLGIYATDISKHSENITLEHVLSNGVKIFFPNNKNLGQNDMKRFITFLGKSGYKENFLDSDLLKEDDIETHLHYSAPGGPLRALYLSSLNQNEPIGFILSNGEKIGEWIHWIPFIRFGREEHDQENQALQLFEIFQDRPWTKEGILMATSPCYSIFHTVKDTDEVVIDTKFFSRFPNPSRVRGTLLVAPTCNHWANQIATQNGYRKIKFYNE